MDSWLFIVGPQRSGTTLLRLMLTSNSSISIPPESQFVVRTDKLLEKRKEDIINHTNQAEVISIIERDKKFEEWDLPITEISQWMNTQKSLTPEKYYSFIYNKYRDLNDESAFIIGDKNPDYLVETDRLKNMFKKAFFLVTYRDPRAISESLKLANKHWKKQSSHLVQAVKTFKDFTSLYEKFSRDSDYYFISYEQLVLEPKATLVSICNWLEIEYEDSMMNYYKINKQKELVHPSRLVWHENTLRAPDSKLLSRWMGSITENDRKYIERSLKKEMKKFGYEAKYSLFNRLCEIFQRK
ncbi:MAG: sulfotransferase [Bacteroidota bacterium]